jgi:hypothetical protein
VICLKMLKTALTADVRPSCWCTPKRVYCYDCFDSSRQFIRQAQRLGIWT